MKTHGPGGCLPVVALGFLSFFAGAGLCAFVLAMFA